MNHSPRIVWIPEERGGREGREATTATAAATAAARALTKLGTSASIDITTSSHATHATFHFQLLFRPHFFFYRFISCQTGPELILLHYLPPHARPRERERERERATPLYFFLLFFFSLSLSSWGENDHLSFVKWTNKVRPQSILNSTSN